MSQREEGHPGQRILRDLAGILQTSGRWGLGWGVGVGGGSGVRASLEDLTVHTTVVVVLLLTEN